MAVAVKITLPQKGLIVDRLVGPIDRTVGVEIDRISIGRTVAAIPPPVGTIAAPLPVETGNGGLAIALGNRHKGLAAGNRQVGDATGIGGCAGQYNALFVVERDVHPHPGALPM